MPIYRQVALMRRETWVTVDMAWRLGGGRIVSICRGKGGRLRELDAKSGRQVLGWCSWCHVRQYLRALSGRCG